MRRLVGSSKLAGVPENYGASAVSASHNGIGGDRGSIITAANGNQVVRTSHPLNPRRGDDALSPVTTDQRGSPRLSASDVDIGAVEVQQPEAAVAVAPVKVAPPVVHHGRRFGP